MANDPREGKPGCRHKVFPLEEQAVQHCAHAPGKTHGEFKRLLDFLTPVQQTGPDDLLSVAALFAGGIDHTSVLLVTGPNGPSSRFANLAQTLVVRIGDGAVATTGIAVAAPDAGDFITRWRTWDQ